MNDLFFIYKNILCKEALDFHGLCYSEQKRTITNIMNSLSLNYYFLFNVHIIVFVLSDNKSFFVTVKKLWYFASFSLSPFENLTLILAAQLPVLSMRSISCLCSITMKNHQYHDQNFVYS